MSSSQGTSAPDGTILCQGFSSLVKEDSNDDSRYALQWYFAPDSWETLPEDSTSREGQDGSWSVNEKHQLILKAPAKKDYWRKTYYDPILVKDDAPFAYIKLDPKSNNFYTVNAKFKLTAIRQFDQAGIMIRFGSEYWLKTGIEVVDHIPRLSAVVTNVYSDWSTQNWGDYETLQNNETDDTTTTTTTQVHCHIRVHCRGNNFVVEAENSNNQWEMVRICQINPGIQFTNDPISNQPGNVELHGDELWAGVFAACPEDQKGAQVVFEEFYVVTGSNFDHHA